MRESLVEPEGGWDIAGGLPPDFVEPPDAGPFEFLEAAPCVALEEAPPPRDGWCEKRRLDRFERRNALEHEVYGSGLKFPITEARDLRADGKLAGRIYQLDAATRYREHWTWAEDGAVETFLQEGSEYGDERRSRWQLQRSCDGRPSHYEITDLVTGQAVAPARFHYNSRGHVTWTPIPNGGTKTAYDAAGNLRATLELDSKVTADYSSMQTLDAAGRVTSNRSYYSGSMGETETILVNTTDSNGRITATREFFYATYVGSPRSRVTRFAYDEFGRKVLAWTYGMAGARVNAERWTYACDGSVRDPLRHEVSSGGTSPIQVTTWTWDAASNVLTEHGGGFDTTYRYECEE